MTRARAKKAQEALKHMVTILRVVQMQGETQAHDQMEAQDPIQDIGGPMTRAKKAQETLKHMVTILGAVQMQGEAHKGELLVLCVDCLG